MDPIDLASKVEERYRRYLKTTFYFRDRVLRNSFEQSLQEASHLSKGPFLEATPVFKRGQTPRSLFQNLLGYPPDKAFLQAVNTDRPLYLHQEEAIRRVFNGRNVVVATGTGSGKTEAFLYPILLHLYHEYAQNKLGPGVRALILYPMNALANDQRDRLGAPGGSSTPSGICTLLEQAHSPFRFTFGQYTGDTPEDENDSSRNARSHMNGRYAGELVLRTEMRRTPPHVLLTNYSMLEYLLLRPLDSELFDNGRAQWWTFLVLDEAHQYRGSKGIEMGMLLRRLKRRLREGGRAGEFRCIVTSASIAGSKEDRRNVAKFAGDLFGEEFLEEDVILGETEPLPEKGQRKFSADLYSLLYQAVNGPAPETSKHLAELAGDLEVPLQLGEETAKVAGELLQRDDRAIQLRHLITGIPTEVQTVADEIFSDLPEQRRVSALSVLIELLVKATDPISDSPLLSARYHLFLRSLEGAFITYWPERKIFLDRKALAGDGATFEVALCRECGQHYLVGRIKNGKLQEAVRDPSHPEFGADFFRSLEDEEMTGSDEDDIETTPKQFFRLCIQCGEIWQAKLGPNGGSCGHCNSLLLVKQESSAEKEDQVPKCSACGYRAPDPIREVVHGTDGPHAVIATTLHQSLPADRRKVLAFADGRQEAAFFAWYLEKSYEDIRNRNLILRAARRLAPYTTEGLSLQELVTGMRDLFRQLQVFEASKGDIDLRREAWLALYREFLTDEPRIALDGVGLIHWSIKWPDGFEIPIVLLRPPWSLGESLAQDLLIILFGFMRRERAVELRTEDAVSIGWDELGLQARQVSVEIVKPKGKRNINSWAGKATARAGFLRRILAATTSLDDEESARCTDETLREIWEAVRKAGQQITSGEGLLIRVGDSHRLNPDWWRAFPLDTSQPLYQCDTCGRLQKASIKDVCPRHKCPGRLKMVRPVDLLENHYRALYEEDLPGRLEVEEHTAQIDKERAREFQTAFKQNKIDVLSCSTTFELGVDLGDLDTVFLRNVPPEGFNYAQRVGRAGRRKGYPGVAITYCRRAPHDLYHFANPQRMLVGLTRPPSISLRNEKIILRHIAAIALSSFFRAFPLRFQNVGTLLKDIGQPTATIDFRNFLHANKAHLENSLSAVVPQEMVKAVGLDNETWIENIAGESSRFALAELEISSDYRKVKEFETALLQKLQKRPEDYEAAKWANARANTIVGEEVLSFLSRKAVIPKYGFPVDVVELDTHRIARSRESTEVSLQRDLAIAVAEFAPTSKLVANKREWTSAGLKKVVGKEWPQRYYRKCTRHNLFKQWGKEDAAPPDKCCDQMAESRYIDPVFGFVTTKGKPDEPKRRPAKTFTTRPYFVGFSGAEPDKISFNLIQLTKTSPGNMVVLCEGKRGEGFAICETCGAGFKQIDRSLLKKGHKTPLGADCLGTIQPHVSLGHEFPTDVLCIQFLMQPPAIELEPIWFAYSLAYAIVEGAAEVLEIPSSDLSATVVYGSGDHFVPPIILYDNVPGGAGLVARLEEMDVLRQTLESALQRVSGACGCSEETSCYGCLRNYRNQFAHQHLARGPIMRYLQMIRTNWA